MDYAGSPEMSMALEGPSVIIPDPPAPKAKRPPKPTLQNLSKEFSSRRSVMGGRDQNVRRWRSMIRLSDDFAGKLKGSQFTNDLRDDRLIRLSRPATIGAEIRRHVGQLRAVYRLAAEDSGEDAENKARRNRAFIQEFFRFANSDYRDAGGPGSLAEGMTRYLYEDGQVWLCVMPEPKRSVMPFRLDVYDSLTCIPVRSGKKLKRFYHVCQMTVEEIRDTWGRTLLPGRDPDSPEDVIGYYDDTYLAVLYGAEGMEWLKSPVAHGIVDSDGNGLIPVAAFFQNGFTGDAMTAGNDSVEDIEANRGRSNIADHESELLELAKLVTANLTITYREANPSMLLPGSPAGTQYRINTGAGAHNPLPDDLKEMPKPATTTGAAAPALLKANIDFLTQEIDNDVGTIAQKQMEYQSSTDRSVSAEQTQSYFASVVEALKEAHVWIATMALTMYKTRNYPEISVTEQSARSGWPFRAPFSPDDVPDVPRVMVEFTEISAMKRMQVQAAMGPIVANGNATPLQMFEAMGVENPELEAQKLAEYTAQMHPAVIQSTGDIFALANLEHVRNQYNERGDTDMANLVEMQRRVTYQKALKALEKEFLALQQGIIPEEAAPQPPAPPMLGGAPPPPPGGMGGAPPPELAALLAQMGQQGPPMQPPMPPPMAPQQMPIGATGVPNTVLSPESVTGGMSRLVPQAPGGF